MSFEEYKKILSFYEKECRMLYLSCGHEPLMTPHFEKYLLYAKRKNIPFISFCTNGVLLNDKIIKCVVDEKIDEIILSFNGYIKADYNRIMKKSDYETVINNIKKLSDYKKTQNSKYPKIRINSLLMKSNIINFDKLLDFIRTYDVDMVQIRELVVDNEQNDIREVKRELISNINSDEREIIFSKIREDINNLRNENKTVIIPKVFLKNQHLDSKEVIKKSSCCIPYFSYWIECDGMIKVCSYDNQSYIGNVFEDELETLVKNRNIYREKALAGKCDSIKCMQNIDSSNVI
jgi:MoaA/NifB/PqqE/SkfB family radical SAM enzyme